jgi:hypothetical protein
MLWRCHGHIEEMYIDIWEECAVASILRPEEQEDGCDTSI